MGDQASFHMLFCFVGSFAVFVVVFFEGQLGVPQKSIAKVDFQICQ